MFKIKDIKLLDKANDRESKIVNKKIKISFTMQAEKSLILLINAVEEKTKIGILANFYCLI